MNVDKLKKGMELKNYKELCKVLEIKQTTGKAKESQLKELARFCEYKKEGQKFIIEKVYKVPKDKEDKRMDRKTQTIMGNMLVEIICTYAKDDALGVHFSKNFLYKVCEMHNEEYECYRYKQEELCKIENIDIDTVRDFYNTSNSVFVANVEKGGKWLKNKKLATLFDTYAVKEESGLDRAVSKEEHAIIQSYEAKVIEEEFKTNRVNLYLDCSEEQNYYTLRKRVCELIREDAEKISQYKECEFKKVLHGEQILSLGNSEYYYPCYEFVGDINRIKKYYDKQFNAKEKEKANDRTVEKITESTDTKIANAKDGKSNKTYRKEDKYKEDMNILIKKQIKKH